jgi:hypothetical protein
MKKFLLSSIIMLGVCGIASAQTDSKAAKVKAQTAAAASTAPSFTPQKAAVMPASDVAAPVTSTDVEAAAATRVATQTAQKAEATSVNAAGEVVPDNDAARREAKMAAAKAANAPKTGKQQ